MVAMLIEEAAKIEESVEILVAIRDQAAAVHASASSTYNDNRTSVDRKKLSDLGLMVKKSYRTIPSLHNVDGGLKSAVASCVELL